MLLLLPVQAMGLDDGKVYAERIRVSLHRLELRGELYKPFESPEDQAGQIIEQVRYHDVNTRVTCVECIYRVLCLRRRARVSRALCE